MTEFLLLGLQQHVPVWIMGLSFIGNAMDAYCHRFVYKDWILPYCRMFIHCICSYLFWLLLLGLVLHACKLCFYSPLGPAGFSLSSLFLPLSSPFTHTIWPPSDWQPAISLLASRLTTQLFEDLEVALQQVLSIQSAQGSETSNPLGHREADFVIMWPGECSAGFVTPGKFSY